MERETRSERSEVGADGMREFVDAGAMAAGKGMKEVESLELGSPMASRKGGVTGDAKGRRMLGLRPMADCTIAKSTESSRTMGDVKDRLGGRIGRGEEGGRAGREQEAGHGE